MPVLVPAEPAVLHKGRSLVVNLVETILDRQTDVTGQKADDMVRVRRGRETI